MTRYLLANSQKYFSTFWRIFDENFDFLAKCGRRR
nr:MAG TPA: hypothetical protein [Bacteriophage sp.]